MDIKKAITSYSTCEFNLLGKFHVKALLFLEQCDCEQRIHSIEMDFKTNKDPQRYELIKLAWNLVVCSGSCFSKHKLIYYTPLERAKAIKFQNRIIWKTISQRNFTSIPRKKKSFLEHVCVAVSFTSAQHDALRTVHVKSSNAIMKTKQKNC